MKFYDKYYENNFEELITYYPRFYRDVFEMVEILKAHGGIADELEANIEQTYLNSFIDYADEDTIEQLEKFLNIGLNKSRTLEERRRLVKSYFVGFGKVSASMLAEMIKRYTGASVDIKFEPFDEEGNNMLYPFPERRRADAVHGRHQFASQQENPGPYPVSGGGDVPLPGRRWNTAQALQVRL